MWTYQSELYHYGVLGMKWGKRKYQNPDGSLTSKGQEKVSKKYKKEMVKALTSLAKNQGNRTVKAYNDTADEYNGGKIEKFNKTHSAKSPTYLEKYEKQFQKDVDSKYNRMTLKELESNKHYQKGKELADKYAMISFDKLAKDNAEVIALMKQS